MASKGKKKKVRKNAELQGLRAANKPEYVTGTGQQMWCIHPETACNGRICDIHNPPTGPEADCPTYWRSDRQLMERLCACGIGHPSSAHMAFLREMDEKNGTDRAKWEGIHGCCGCCGSWKETPVKTYTPTRCEQYFDDSPMLPHNGASDWERGVRYDYSFLDAFFNRPVQIISPPAIPWDPAWVDHDASANGIGPVCKNCGNLIDSHPVDHALDCSRNGNDDGLG